MLADTAPKNVRFGRRPAWHVGGFGLRMAGAARSGRGPDFCETLADQKPTFLHISALQLQVVNVSCWSSRPFSHVLILNDDSGNAVNRIHSDSMSLRASS